MIKYKYILLGGPFNGHKVWLSGTPTLFFKSKCFYGRYIKEM